MEVERATQDSGAVQTSQVDFEPNNVESLATVLTQGLRSSDSRLIDRCLVTNNEGVIKTTVARMGAPDAALLLESCVNKMQTRVNRGSNLALWIKAVLLRHTAYLMSSPGNQQVLSELEQCIESRLAVQQPLAMLSGRLDLLLAQTLAKKEAGDMTATFTQDTEMDASDSDEEEEESSEEE